MASTQAEHSSAEGRDPAALNQLIERPPKDPGERTPILYIAPWVDLGGSDKGTIDWFKHIDRERWAPSIITTQPSLNRWLPELEPYAEEIWALPDSCLDASSPPSSSASSSLARSSSYTS